MKILDLDHAQITIPVGEEDKAREFYCEILGLLEIPKPESLRKNSGFWLKAGLQEVHVGVETGVNRNQTKAHLAYQVDDLNGWRVRLEKAGLSIKNSTPIPGRIRFELRDPFGNRVELLQYIEE